jgi:hypothetical protein
LPNGSLRRDDVTQKGSQRRNVGSDPQQLLDQVYSHRPPHQALNLRPLASVLSRNAMGMQVTADLWREL